MKDDSQARPVLNTIRELLKFKDWTTIPEIARTAGLKQANVLDVINRNGHMVWRKRENGRITKVDTRTPLYTQLFDSGAFFRQGQQDYGATLTLEFKGHDPLREEITVNRTGGGLGDSYPYRCVLDTVENRDKLRAAGLLPYEEIVIDDRLWVE